MTSSPRRLTWTLWLATPLASLLSVGCSLDPKVPEQRHSLNQAAIEENEDLAGDAQAQANLFGALTMLFGTPGSPSMMRVAEWVEDEFDPNAGGSDELSDAEWNALVADNEEHFAPQLAAIAAGRYDDVAVPLYSHDLWSSWEDHLELLDEEGMTAESLLDPDDEEGGTWLENALALWTGFYPSQSETGEMYRVQCQHCHGASGGGDGSTSEWLNPLPRDYRPGIFKFTALKDKAHPRRQDLARVLRDGIYTTSMPSFGRFSEARLQGLVDHVRLLSKRGETEILLASDFEAFSSDVDTALSIDKVKDTYLFVNGRWPADDELVITYDGDVPQSTADSIARGKILFLGGAGVGANCVSCHGQRGLGDGASAKEVDPETEEQVLVKDEWGNEIKPRNLTRGLFRFGSRPIDIYRRVYAGINGTPMPAHIGMEVELEDGSKRALDENDMWDLVHYVQYLGAVDIEPAVHTARDAFEHEQAHAAAGDHGHGDHDHDQAGEHGEGDGHGGDADHDAAHSDDHDSGH